MEPATFRFVAQHLNRCGTAVPPLCRVFILTFLRQTMYYVPREYSIAALLLLLFMALISLVPVLNLLYFYISTFRIMCAVPNMAVFCSSLTSLIIIIITIIIQIILKCVSRSYNFLHSLNGFVS